MGGAAGEGVRGDAIDEQGLQGDQLAVEIVVDAVEVDAFRSGVEAARPFGDFSARHHFVGRALDQQPGTLGRGEFGEIVEVNGWSDCYYFFDVESMVCLYR